jgi:hypothetical protein
MAHSPLIRSSLSLVLLAVLFCGLPAPSLARQSVWSELLERVSSQASQLLFGPSASTPSISALTGCYWIGPLPRLQCPVGASIRVNGAWFNASSAVTVSVGSSYECTLTSPASYSSIDCTLPESVQPSDLDTPLPVTVTVGGLTTSAFPSVTFFSHIAVPTVASIRGCTGGLDGAPAIGCRPGQTITLVGQQFWTSPIPSTVTFGGSSTSPYKCARLNGSNSTYTLCTVPAVDPADVGVVFPVTLTVSVSPYKNATTLTSQFVYTGGLSVSASARKAL